MPIYLMPATVGARLKEPMTEAQRLLDIKVLDAKLFNYDLIYTKEELKAFGVPQGQTFVIIANDGSAFEQLIPERRNGQLNYLHLRNETAIKRIYDRLPNIPVTKE